ncbi:MAG: hypothetical protein L3J01_04345 [Thiomicrorhabdus sp.]|nr:hypothetical protein [Thiomicrorhabdus sp.]
MRSAIESKIKQAEQGARFEQIEKEIHAAFIEAERAVLSEALEKYDIDLPTVMLEGKEYRQVVRCEQTYTSAVGSIRVERSLYRHKSGSPSICPLELRTGIVEGNRTPIAAKQALLLVSQLTPYETAHLLGELGAMQPSKSSLDRLPKKLSHRWEARRESFEQSLRQQFEVPEDAVTVAVSLDGVLVPMQGGVVMPGDSRYEEASCGTLTYYDREGELLATRRYGCMPEHKKRTLKDFLEKEVSYALNCRQNLQLVKVADGAKDNWTFLDGILPDGESVLDFYHAAEHLKKAFEIVYGVKAIKASTEFSKYRSILRHDKKGIDKIIAHLGYLLKKNPIKITLQTEINYFKNNKQRCRYAAIADANFPIGSGIVEATCKTLVSQRLKRSVLCIAWKCNCQKT